MKRKLSVLFAALLTFVLILSITSGTALASREDASDDTSEVVEEEKSEDAEEDTTDEEDADEVIEFEEEMICNGVFIDEIEIGGKSVTEAREEVDKYLKEILKKKIIVKANEKEQSTSAKDLGATFAEADYVDQALNIGKFGNVIRRYKDLKDVENDKKVFQVEVSFDEKKLSTFVEKKATKCNIEAKEPSMSPKGGRLPSSGASSSFNFKEGVIGKCIDVESVKAAINEQVKDWDKQDIVIEAKVTEKKPKHDIESLKKCNDRLAQFTTNYSSSGWERSKNITTAASKIDGSVVYPGETFSILNKIAPFTKANGYAEAGSYSQGKVVDSLGGGVCQVSTTLYNAVLRAELDIVMRNNHSMVVSYVPVSADAMIASSASRDFKFKNNTDVPVYIEAYTSGKNITFNIYGEETRPSNRSIRFENKILKTIQPGKDVITEDKTKPTSYREVTQSAHVGYRAEYYKIVMVNGVEQQRIKINSSYYQAAPKYITVGTKEEKKEEPTDTEGEIVEDADTPQAVRPGSNATGTLVPQPTRRPTANNATGTTGNRPTAGNASGATSGRTTSGNASGNAAGRTTNSTVTGNTDRR